MPTLADFLRGAARPRTAPPPTLAASLDRAAPYLAPALLDASALADVRAVAAGLPQALSRRIGFEVRLGDPAPRADFLACITRDERGLLLAPGAGTLLELPSWAPLRTLAEAWMADPVLDAALSSLWIELDLAQGAPAEPVPSVFFGLEDAVPARDHAEGWREAVERDLAATGAALAALGGAPLPEGVRRHLGACFRALPPGAKVFQVGAMLSRGTRAVRVCVRRLGPALPAYLAGVGWPGCVARLCPAVDDLLAGARWVALDLDVGAQGVLPAIGLECACDAALEDMPRWRALLDALAARGLVRPAKAEALLGWPGLDDDGEEALVRALAHVKLAWRDGALREAKGYFGVWQRALAWRFLQRRVG